MEPRTRHQELRTLLAPAAFSLLLLKRCALAVPELYLLNSLEVRPLIISKPEESTDLSNKAISPDSLGQYCGGNISCVTLNT